MPASMLVPVSTRVGVCDYCWFLSWKKKPSKLNWYNAKPSIERLEFHRRRLPRSASSWQSAPSVLISEVRDRAAANQRSDLQRSKGTKAGTEKDLDPIGARRIRTIPPTIPQEPMRLGSSRNGCGIECMHC